MSLWEGLGVALRGGTPSSGGKKGASERQRGAVVGSLENLCFKFLPSHNPYRGPWSFGLLRGALGPRARIRSRSTLDSCT